MSAAQPGEETHYLDSYPGLCWYYDAYSDENDPREPGPYRAEALYTTRSNVIPVRYNTCLLHLDQLLDRLDGDDKFTILAFYKAEENGDKS